MNHLDTLTQSTKPPKKTVYSYGNMLITEA